MQSAVRRIEPSWSLGSSFVPASAGYRPRTPEKTVLHKVVREHLSTFLLEARGNDPDGEGVPAFIEDELRKFLACGSLSGGVPSSSENATVLVRGNVRDRVLYSVGR
jgi:hypothetical protein